MQIPIPHTNSHIRYYLGKYRRPIFLGVCCVFFTQLIRQISPLILGYFVDHLIVLKQNNESFWPLALRCISFLLVTVALRGVFQFLMRHYIVRNSRQVEMELRQTLLQKLQTLTPSFFHRHPTGDLMSRSTADIEAVRNLFGPGILHSANSVFALILVIAFMCSVDWVLTLWIVIPTAILLALAFIWMQRLYSLSQEVQSRIADISSLAQENFSGVEVVKAFRREEHHISLMENECNSYVRALLSYALQHGFMRAFLQSFMGFLLIILLYVGGNRMIQGDLKIGGMIAMVGYTGRLIWPLMAAGWVAGLMQRGMAGMERIQEIFNTEPDVQTKEIPTPLPSLDGDIRIRNLDFAYSSDGPRVLHNINLQIPKGSQLAIVGATGSGKSTLVKLLLHLYPVQSGTIEFNGIDINDLPVQTLRQHIAYISQEPYLFSDTISYNIGFGNIDLEDSQEDIQRSAITADIDKDIQNFKHGYKEILGERGVTLSGGQKQRTAIARGILKQAPVMIFDDSFSSVDTQTEHTILTNVQESLQDCTRILIAHRVSTVQDSDQIIVLDKGEIVERGKHEELLQLHGRYAELHNLEQLQRKLKANG